MLPAATLQGSGSEDEPRGGRGQRQRADEPLLLCRLGFQREPRFPMTTTQILLAKGELTESAREGRRSLKVQFKSRGPVLARGLPFPLASSRAPPAPVPTRPPTPRGQPVLRIGSAFRRGQGQRGGREALEPASTKGLSCPVWETDHSGLTCPPSEIQGPSFEPRATSGALSF